ncbi:MAG TPA: YihY family inner membrane protein, partial [Burkholderiaceae bacterium]
MPVFLDPLLSRLRLLSGQLSRFPWKNTALTLRERFREDRLGLTASSLTFTTLLALVPFITVALAVFTAFPMFGKVQYGLQKWLVDSLVPDSIARQVLGYLTQFAAKASRLGVVGLSFLLVTALALILTIDRTLNSIWRVRRLRPLGQRVLIYWAVMTLGPLALGLSLALSSYVLSASRGLVGVLPGSLRFVLDMIEFCLLAGGMAGLYRFVPNTQVAWGHAWSGGVFVAVGIELAKRVLSAYLVSVPTYSTIYGAFATLPILLVWIYVAWVIVLLGAVVAAYLPSLLAGVARRGGGPGWPLQLAVEMLQQLHAARSASTHGLTALQLAQALRVDALQIVPVLEALEALDWVGQLRDVD